MRETYLSLVRRTQEPVGLFVDVDHCDSLLHSGLLGAGGVEVYLHAAREESGRWLRRPVYLQECMAAGASKSTISRDMLLGVLWYTWMARDLDMAERLWAFGESRDWKMGDSDNTVEGISRIYYPPSSQSTLAELIYQLGGANHTVRKLPIRSLGGQTGFRKHLEVLDILLWGEMTGGYTVHELSILDSYLARYPSDALVAYATGNYGRADYLLRLHHPADRLPTSADMCSPLAYERDTLAPCPDVDPHRIHAPIHFLMISQLLLGRAS
jgi:hypothetical protein